MPSEDELYESRRMGFKPEEPEYEDEAPGTVLGAVRMGKGWLPVSLVQVALLAGLGYWGYQLEYGDWTLSKDNRFPLSVLWNILPVFAVICLLSVSFIRVNQTGAMPSQTFRASLVVWLQILIVLGWFALKVGFKVSFWDPR